MSIRVSTLFALLLASALPAAGQIQTGKKQDAGGPPLANPLKQKLKVGVVVKAVGGPCQGIIATTPIPKEWPEQQVNILESDISPSVRRVSYRMVGGTVKQMLIDIPMIPAGQEARAVVTLEIVRSTQLAPSSTTTYSIPKKLSRDLMVYLGPSPYIESRNPKIASLAKEVTKDKTSDWEKVEAIYDWVREHVKYENGPLKGAVRALHDKTGDCEELSSLFIAMCRSLKIPARTVWVPGHCYPEFYLVDEQDHGYWFPCQAAGTRSFGGIPEQRPILQKGDNFRDPERPRERQRYLSEFLKGSGKKGGGQPKVEFVREVIGA